jgi:hypothetical protein
VSKFIKALAWVCVLLLNLFFVYFSMARGLQRGLDWQRLYCVACVIQLTVEVLFYETSECAMVNFFIPNLARSEVQGVTFAIHQAIQSMCLSVSEASVPLLDAPRYLFLSTRLAERFPDLVESVIVRSYHSYSPGELSRKWKISHVSSSYFGTGDVRVGSRVRRMTFTGLLVGCLQYLGSMSISIQRFFIHALQPVMMAGVAATIALIAHDPLYLLIFTPLVGYALYRLWEHWHSEGDDDDESREDAVVPLPHNNKPPKQLISMKNSLPSVELPHSESKTGVESPPLAPPLAQSIDVEDEKISIEEAEESDERFELDDMSHYFGEEEEDGSHRSCDDHESSRMDPSSQASLPPHASNKQSNHPPSPRRRHPRRHVSLSSEEISLYSFDDELSSEFSPRWVESSHHSDGDFESN